jgi:hypothetical protein
VSAFDIEPDGSLTNRRSWATFGEVPTARGLNDTLASLVVAPDGCAPTPKAHCGSLTR